MLKTKLRDALKRLIHLSGYDVVKLRELPDDFSREDAEIISAVRAYTMTTDERLYVLMRAVEYVVRNGIPGALVECGVWKGGSMMAAALTLAREGCDDRDLYLFDPFEGMPKPSAEDVSHLGEDAATTFERTKRGDDASDWCLATREEVEAALHGTGYDPSRMHFVQGKVEDTIPQGAPETIALLRLDTDWYESTRHELIHLFPRLVTGGVLIIDDYGYWQGARQAVDEYVAENRLRLLLNRIDHTGRVAVKL